MAVFDASFANPKTKKGSSQDYGFLVDQLDIKESQLESDGKLAPSDYDVLIGEAQKMYSHPGLSPAQRSNIEVKIASYRSNKKKNTLKDKGDLAQLGREVEDDYRKANILLGNNPANYLKATAAAQNAKISQISDAINNLDEAGDDSSEHVNQLNEALQDYSDTLEALDVVENYKPGKGPSSDFVAYVTTNSRGEITDVKVGREGSSSGYLETNGLYGGLKIYGKLNRKESGKNTFFLGNTKFSAADTVVPNADGSMKASVLINEAQQKGSKAFTIATAGYSDVDLAKVRTQSAIRSGGWVEGDKGFLYQKQEDGSYKKYVNADRAKLGITDNDIVKVPRSYEQGMLGSVTETIDGSTAPVIPTPLNFNMQEPTNPSAISPTSTMTTSTSPSAIGRPRTGAPTESAPDRPQGIAARAVSAVGGFLGRVFGGGK